MPEFARLSLENLKKWLCPNNGLPSDLLRKEFELGTFRSFPNLHKMAATKQNPKWHPEGNVLNHTLCVMDEFWQRSRRVPAEQRFAGSLAALLHDNGKSVVTCFRGGRWRATGHEAAGLPEANTFLEKFRVTGEEKSFVLNSVAQHMMPMRIYRQLRRHEISLKEYEKQVNNLVKIISPKWLDTFLTLCEADSRGRGEAANDIPIEPALSLFRAYALKKIHKEDFWKPEIAEPFQKLGLNEAQASLISGAASIKKAGLANLDALALLMDSKRLGTSVTELKTKRPQHIHRDTQGRTHMHGNCSYDGLSSLDYLNALSDIAACSRHKFQTLNIHIPDVIQYREGDEMLAGFKFMLFAEELASAFKVKLVWENSPKICRERNFALEKQVKYYPPGFKRCLDVGHLMLGHDPSEAQELILRHLAVFGRQIALIHLHVNNGEEDLHDTNPARVNSVLGFPVLSIFTRSGVPVIYEERGTDANWELLLGVELNEETGTYTASSEPSHPQFHIMT